MTWADYKSAWRSAAHEESCAAMSWVCWHIIVSALVLACVIEACRRIG